MSLHSSGNVTKDIGEKRLHKIQVFLFNLKDISLYELQILPNCLVTRHVMSHAYLDLRCSSGLQRLPWIIRSNIGLWVLFNINSANDLGEVLIVVFCIQMTRQVLEEDH